MENRVNMKNRIITAAVSFAFMALALAGCDSSGEKTLYDGPEYVMFSDTLAYFPVSNSTDYFEIPVGSTIAAGHDRTFGIEVDDSKSTAVEGYHFHIESNSVTIKAGERAASVRVRGVYEHIKNGETFVIALRLIAKDNLKWDLYGETTKVEMLKSCPFDINAFTGYCKVTSTFFTEYMMPTQYRIVKSELGKEPNTVVIKDMFYKGYDITLKFDGSDPLKPFISMDDQILGSTAEAFGTIHGNGKLMVGQPSAYVSYFNACETFVMQYITVYVEEVGTVGTYVNVIEWISDAQAEQLK
jgi:hypothetical protein